MAQHLLTPPSHNYVDKRRQRSNDEHSHKVGQTFFTTNAAGTVNTAVGVDATLATGVNIVRLSDKFKMFDSTGALKEETVFEITAVASAVGVTTVTYTPASAVASGVGSTLRAIESVDYMDNESLDERLNTINGVLYSQARLDGMTQNDKVYALRVNDDPGSL